jgi:hypothetical protein
LKRGLFEEGVPFFGHPFLFILILFMVVSCTGFLFRKESKSVRIVEGVPFYVQKEYQCGPAFLSEIVNFWDIGVSPKKIAEEVYS